MRNLSHGQTAVLMDLLRDAFKPVNKRVIADAQLSDVSAVCNVRVYTEVACNDSADLIARECVIHFNLGIADSGVEIAEMVVCGTSNNAIFCGERVADIYR